MTLLGRWFLVLGTGAVLIVAAAAAPLAFRRMNAFRVTRVEVTGSRYMQAEAAVTAAGITDSSSVFDDPSGWVERLREQPLVANARVQPRPPGTIRIDLTETEPVALLRTPELRPVDARGRLLPISTEGTHLDAPVLAIRSRIGEDSIADSLSIRLIQGLLAVRANDPALAAAVSEVDRAHGGGLRLVLTEPADAEILLPEQPESRTLREIGLAMEHLRAENPAGSPGGSGFDRLARIDARFPDELFVSLRSRRTN
jgi:POTRA domain, FtsQ-type